MAIMDSLTYVVNLIIVINILSAKLCFECMLALFDALRKQPHYRLLIAKGLLHINLIELFPLSLIGVSVKNTFFSREQN